MQELARTNEVLPAINATLNGIATVLLIIGFILIKKKKISAHRNVMWAAFAVSSAFLANYLYYHFNFDSKPFRGQGSIRYFYFSILISHIILATLMVPFILRLLWLGVKNKVESHKRLARWVWPVWIYTSLTGVLIYMMLYQWFDSP